MSGSGISWAICKSAPRSRQITTPAPHHSVLRGWMPFLPPKQQHQSIEGRKKITQSKQPTQCTCYGAIYTANRVKACSQHTSCSELNSTSEQRTVQCMKVSSVYFIYFLFKHQRQRAEATYMPVKSVQ